MDDEREMTLKEWVNRLPEFHLVNKEYKDLQERLDKAIAMQQPVEMMNAFGIWVVGHDAYPVAIFRYEEGAVEWARENFFGAWLMKQVQMPAMPFCTEEELAEAKIKAEKMAVLFKQSSEMD